VEKSRAAMRVKCEETENKLGLTTIRRPAADTNREKEGLLGGGHLSFKRHKKYLREGRGTTALMGKTYTLGVWRGGPPAPAMHLSNARWKKDQKTSYFDDLGEGSEKVG